MRRRKKGREEGKRGRKEREKGRKKGGWEKHTLQITVTSLLRALPAHGSDER
jgi:hypothetical protein